MDETLKAKVKRIKVRWLKATWDWMEGKGPFESVVFWHDQLCAAKHEQEVYEGRIL